MPFAGTAPEPADPKWLKSKHTVPELNDLLRGFSLEAAGPVPLYSFGPGSALTLILGEERKHSYKGAVKIAPCGTKH